MTTIVDFEVEKEFVDVLDEVDPVCTFPCCECQQHPSKCLFLKENQIDPVNDEWRGVPIYCYKCRKIILDGFTELEERTFHVNCFNRYEHYYGLDKPLD